MSALNWVRGKAKITEEFMTITPEESARSGAKPGLWKVTRAFFSGNLPTRMAFQIRDERGQGKLINTHTETTQTVETLKIGGQYRSEFGKCIFSRTDYTWIGA